MSKTARAEGAEGVTEAARELAESHEARLHELYEAGQKAWLGVALSEDAFARFAASAEPRGARRGDRDPPLGTEESGVERIAGPAIQAPRAADLYLACACAEGVPEALKAFDRRYLVGMEATLARIDRSPAFVDEVRQDVREKLFVARGGGRPKIAEYRGKGSLEGFVRVIAIRAALDLRRGAAPDAAGEEEAFADRVAPGGDVELSLIKVHYRSEFKAAFEAALATLSSRERNVLRLHILDGLNIEQIGTLYKAHRATVARWIAASRKKIDEGTRQALADKLKLGEGELASLMGLVQSQLDVSVSRLLAEARD